MNEKREPLFRTEMGYNDVAVSKAGIHTQGFLDASSNLLKIFDLFGNSPIFLFAERDLGRDIIAVRRRYSQNPSTAMTLQAMVESAVKEGDDHSIQGIIRLLRTLTFSCTAFCLAFDDKTMQPSEFFKLAYEVTLRDHHNFIMRSLASLAFNAVPNRDKFFGIVTEGAPIEEMEGVMVKHFDALGGFLETMRTFIESNNYGKV